MYALQENNTNIFFINDSRNIHKMIMYRKNIIAFISVPQTNSCSRVQYQLVNFNKICILHWPKHFSRSFEIYFHFISSNCWNIEELGYGMFPCNDIGQPVIGNISWRHGNDNPANMYSSIYCCSFQASKMEAIN